MSPNVLKVAIMLEELEKPYVLRFVAVFKGEQFTPEFLAMNPLERCRSSRTPRSGRGGRARQATYGRGLHRAVH
jgi:GST-like protein